MVDLLYLVAVFVSIAVTFYLIIDYRGPSEISLKTDSIFGFSILRAQDLVVQEYDKEGNLWSTRGMIVYKLKKGEDSFKRISHVPTGFSIFWLRNFSIIRRLTIRPECVEMVANENGDICALSAGKIWLLISGEKKFKKTLKLNHYGIGDQGIRNDGIASINGNTVFFGEYFRNPHKDKVRVYKSISNLLSWQTVYEFESGQIRHIHAIQKDPFTEKLWILTGDKDKESMIAWTDNEFNSIVPIGQGSQMWRVCQLVFTEDAIYWGADTTSESEAGIYRWDRVTSKIKKLQKIEGAVFFGIRLAKGTIVMSTDRIGIRTELDNRTRLFIFKKDSEIISSEFGTWNHTKKILGFKTKSAMLRFQRNQGGASLAITCLNLKELPDGELLIISEENLLKTIEKR